MATGMTQKVLFPVSTVPPLLLPWLSFSVSLLLWLSFSQLKAIHQDRQCPPVPRWLPTQTRHLGTELHHKQRLLPFQLLLTFRVTATKPARNTGVSAFAEKPKPWTEGLNIHHFLLYNVLLCDSDPGDKTTRRRHSGISLSSAEG